MSSGGVVEEQQQSSWLVQRLQASAGPQSFMAVMDWLLNDPAHGYYGSGQVRFGSGGDFVTSPSQGPVFAELLGRQLWPCLDALAAESGPLTLIEWGPGDGQLMRDLIDGIGAESPAWLDRLELVLVESSPALQARQQQTLAGAAVPVHWCSPQQLAAEPRRGLIVAHELLDALPVQRFGLQNGHWHEWLVGLDGQQQPCWQVGACHPAACFALSRMLSAVWLNSTFFCSSVMGLRRSLSRSRPRCTASIEPTGRAGPAAARERIAVTASRPLPQGVPGNSARRKQSTLWSLTMPVACMCAYMMVEPTKRKPRCFRSRLSLSDSGLVAW